MAVATMLTMAQHHVVEKEREPALAAEVFTPRLRYSGASIGFQLASVFAGGPAPMIATALLAAIGSGYVIALYIFGIVARIISAGIAVLNIAK